MPEYAVEGSRNARQVECLDEQPRISDLAGAAAEEAPKLGLRRPTSPLRLLLEGAKSAEAFASLENGLDPRRAELANELALEVGIAHVEAETLHAFAREIRTEPRSLQSAAEAPLLADVAESGEANVAPLSTKVAKDCAERLRTSDSDDRDALGFEVTAAPSRQGLERDLVAHSLDENECGGVWDRGHGGNDALPMTSVVPTTEWAYGERRPWAPMDVDEVVRLVDLADTAGIEMWIDGGWGVDALLEEQMREHDDLDVVIELANVERLEQSLGRAGYDHVAGDAPKSFILVDALGHQVDVHPVVFDTERGGGVYMMEDGGEWVYPGDGFSGRGRIGGREVRCLTPEVQVLVHDGYELEDKDYRELFLLHERFGVALPAEYAARARDLGAG